MEPNPSCFIAIDPGLNECGYAYFDEDDQLCECGLVTNTLGLEYTPEARSIQMALDVEYVLHFLPADRVYVEQMFVRRNLQAAFANMIILSTVAGAIGGAMAPERKFRYVLSNDWTDGRTKAQNHPRIRARLSDSEAVVLWFGLEGIPKDNHKEVLDAVGIGLYVANRL